MIVCRHASRERSARLALINHVKRERELLLTHVEPEQLINALAATATFQEIS